MEHLPNDLKREIVEHLSVPSDLKNLALTCTSWTGPANHQLYSDVTINVFDPRSVNQFISGVASGAHIRAIKALTVTDCPPMENVNSKPGRYRSQGCDLRERDEAIFRLLHMFPPNRLHSFKFMSADPVKRPMSKQCFKVLCSKQRKLQHLYTIISPEFYEVQNHRGRIEIDFPPRITDLVGRLDLRSFHAHFVHSKTSLALLGALLDSNPNIRQLSLSNTHVDSSNANGWSPPQRKSGVIKKKRHLQTFVLNKFGSFQAHKFTSLSQFVDFAGLTRLMLWHCDAGDSLHSFLRQLGRDFQQRAPRLKHLAVDVCSGNDQHSIDSEMGKMYKACTGLKSLHLGWYLDCDDYGEHEYDTSPSLLYRHLNQSIRSLDLLSLHNHGLDYNDDLDNLPEMPRRSSVRHLGMQLIQYEIDREFWSDVKMSLGFLEHYPHLQTLHVRQSPKCGRTFSPRTFADFFFGYLDEQGFCSKLRVLIFGQHSSPTKNAHGSLHTYDEDLAEDGKSIGQYYFVKGTQIMVYGECRAVAVPVELSWLRAREPHLDILDYDPTRDWNRDWPVWTDD